MSLGDTLRTLREARGLHQYELAKLLDVPQSCISDWETGKTKPRRDRINPIANALGVKPARIRRLMP